MGFAGGYEHSDLSTSRGANAATDRANAGAVLKYNPGLLLLAAGVTGSAGWTDTERNISFGGFNGTATASTRVDALNGRLHASYLFNQGGWYWKPIVDANVTRLNLDGFSEQGGNGANLIVSSSAATVYSVSPALEIGGDLPLGNGMLARPFIRGGVTAYDPTSFKLTAAFAAAPTLPFQVSSKIDGIVADVSAGVDIFGTGNSVLRFQYDGQIGDTTQRHAGSIKGSLPF